MTATIYGLEVEVLETGTPLPTGAAWVTGLEVEVLDLPPAPPTWPTVYKGMSLLLSRAGRLLFNRYSVDRVTGGFALSSEHLIGEVVFMIPVTFTAGADDSIDFTEDGGPELTGYIAGGTYWPVGDVGTAVAAAMNAAGCIGTYVAVDAGYNNVMIVETSGLVGETQLLFATGSHVATEAGTKLGFVGDQVGATVYTGATLPEFATGYIADEVDFMAFDQPATVAIVYEDGTVGAEFTVPRNGSRSMSGRIRGFKYRNADSATSDTYLEVVGWRRE